MLRYLTGGESHGKSLVAIVDGVPSGLKVESAFLNRELSRRMAGFGRGKRMAIEKDAIEIVSGLRRSYTIGSPVTVMIANVDHSLDRLPEVLRPRPGHADLAGALKYGHTDMRNVLERASARDTASRVAVGAIAKLLLKGFGIDLASHVVAIGPVEARAQDLSFARIVEMAERSTVRCADPKAGARMVRSIEAASKDGDTLGGIFEVIVHGCPPGLGSYSQWDRRLDGLLAKALVSIQAVKGVSFGIGFEAAARRGSSVHDAIFYDTRRGFYRKTNAAGGIEGGMTNGEDVVIRAVMKPIATLTSALPSVDIVTKKAARAAVERADVCAVPACGVVGEAVVAYEIANAFLEKFGGDSVEEIRRNYDGYVAQVKRF